MGEHGVGTSMLCYGFPIIGAYWHIVDRSDHWNHIGVLCVWIEFPWISTLIEYICPPVPQSRPLGPPDRRLNARDSADPVDGEGVVFAPAGTLHNCPLCPLASGMKKIAVIEKFRMIISPFLRCHLLRIKSINGPYGFHSKL